MKTFNWNKVDSPMPVKELNKGSIKRTPIAEAFGNAKKVLSPKNDIRPIPDSGSFKME